MASIFMLSLVFGPDTVSTANMMTDIAHGLCTCGHKVTVLTTMPHYNPSDVVRANPIYRSRRLYTRTNEDGVDIVRLWMPLKGQAVWRRVLDYVWFHVLALLLGIIVIRGRQDIVYVPSPPITLGLMGWLLSLLKGAKFIYDVRELWPDVPVRLGLLKNKWAIRLVYAVEYFVYNRTAAITTIARSFIDNLVRRGVSREKLFFTPNFVDVDLVTPRLKDNDFAREHGLVDKFVVFYAGNIGLTQGLEVLLVEVGKLLESQEPRAKNQESSSKHLGLSTQDLGLRTRPAIIVVIGDGAGRAKLEQAVRESGLSNIMCLPFQPFSRVPDTYATADVCISPMKFGFSYDTVPSKIYTAMSAARPVVSACEADTESAHLLCEADAGIIVSPESAAEMADAIQQLRHSPELAQRLGANARAWVVAYYSKTAVVAEYDRVMRLVSQTA
ncbi:MAG: glycosyltransferase family 4 protein [Chloroflexota bacterium]|jgi:colanic acid biosynthesis glycosyl transferase WcaI